LIRVLTWGDLAKLLSLPQAKTLLDAWTLRWEMIELLKVVYLLPFLVTRLLAELLMVLKVAVACGG
jgi:hypothetical protein